MVKILFVGDIFLKRNSVAPLCDNSVQAIIDECDICCCNLEGAIDAKNRRFEKLDKVGPSLIQSSLAADIMIKAGFNMFAMANNHILDYGKDALRYTQEMLKEYLQVGISEDGAIKYKEIDIKNSKIAIFSVAESGFGCAETTDGIGYQYFLDERLFSAISKAKQNGNYVIINVHAGAELLDIPLPEIRRLYRTYIDVGADIIIGHHPHVLQGFEDYNGGKIYYSLGNFCFDDEEDPDICKIGGIAIVTLKKNIAVSHEIYITENRNGKVSLHSDSQLIKSLCNKIDNVEAVNDWCINQYLSLIKPIYYRGNSFGIWDKTCLEKFKLIVKIFVNRIKDSDAFMFHNINNETNYWITNRALKTMKKRDQL